MLKHVLNADGACIYCTAAPDQSCEPLVIFIPSAGRIWDFVGTDGLTHYGRRTLAQVQSERLHPDAVILPLEEATRLYEARFIAPVSEITRDKFWYALEVLPPAKWRNHGTEETFFVPERIAGRIVDWYARHGERYFTLADSETLTHSEIMLRVALFLNPAPVGAVGTHV